MGELTDEQEARAKKAMDQIINFIWAKIEIRVLTYGESFDVALRAVMSEIIEESKNG